MLNSYCKTVSVISLDPPTCHLSIPFAYLELLNEFQRSCTENIIAFKYLQGNATNCQLHSVFNLNALIKITHLQHIALEGTWIKIQFFRFIIRWNYCKGSCLGVTIGIKVHWLGVEFSNTVPIIRKRLCTYNYEKKNCGQQYHTIFWSKNQGWVQMQNLK